MARDHEKYEGGEGGEGKEMTDEDIVDALQDLVNESVSFNDTKLVSERLDVDKYYNAEYPTAQSKGKSKYVSQDVYDAVESMKATLLETFAAGNDIGVFEPLTEADVQHCWLAAQYVDHVIFSQNDGFNVFSDTVHNGLTARVGVVKVGWEKQFETGEEEFTDFDETALAKLLEDPNIQPKELEERLAPDGVTKLYSGCVDRKEDVSQCRIEVIPPEQFFIEPRADNMYKATMGHRVRLSKSQLRKRGVSAEDIEAIGDDKSDGRWQTDEEVTKRHDESGTGSFQQPVSPQDATKKVWVYEVFTDLDTEGTGMAKLQRFLYAGDVLLEQEAVKCRPYAIFAPLRKPHKVHGDNYAKKVFGTQNANTVLTRGILDHTVIANNPRLQVLKGTLNDPRELIDNRYGGIVNVNRPDGIVPLMQAPLNPYVFQTLQLLDYKLETTTGVSKLSQGLNKDAVSKQNSQAMVEQMTSASMQRQKIIARRFANDLVKRLFELVYDVIRENEKKARLTEIAGNWVEVQPASWRGASRRFKVQLALGYGEKDKVANEWIGLHQMIVADPAMSPQYGPDKRFNVFRRIFEAKGVKDISSYITPPEQVKPQPPDPIEMAKLDLKKRELDIREREVAVAEKAANNTLQIGTMKNQVTLAKAEGVHAIQADNMTLKERIFEHDKLMDAAEIELEKQTLAQGNLKGVAAV